MASFYQGKWVKTSKIRIKRQKFLWPGCAINSINGATPALPHQSGREWTQSEKGKRLVNCRRWVWTCVGVKCTRINSVTHSKVLCCCRMAGKFCRWISGPRQAQLSWSTVAAPVTLTATREGEGLWQVTEPKNLARSSLWERVGRRIWWVLHVDCEPDNGIECGYGGHSCLLISPICLGSHHRAIPINLSGWKYWRFSSSELWEVIAQNPCPLPPCPLPPTTKILVYLSSAQQYIANKP